MSHDAWGPDAHCSNCGRKVGEGFQHDDGRIDDGTDPVFEPPNISMLTIDVEYGRPTDIGVTPTSAAARHLADVLVTAADEIDRWSAR